MPNERSSLVTSPQSGGGYSSIDNNKSSTVTIKSPDSGSLGVNAQTSAADAKRRSRELTALFCAMIFCFVFMVVECIGGYLAHSLALLTDAAHLFTDVFAYALSIMALKASARAKSANYSFGWHRAEVVGTLFSVFTIWALVGGICVEAFNRAVTMYECAANPSSPSSEFLCEGVDCKMLIVIGTLGLAVNFGCAGILKLGGSHGHSHFGVKCEGHGDGADHGHDHGHSHGGGPCDGHDDHDDHGHSHEMDSHGHAHDDHGHSHDHEDHGHSHDGHDDHGHGYGGHSVKTGFAINAAMLHALGDSVQSAGVILAGIFMYVMIQRTEGTHISKHSWYNLADPACSVLFAFVTVYMTKGIIVDLMNILMEASPSSVDAKAIGDRLLLIPGVIDMHDLHVWSIASGKIALSVHLVSDTHADVLAATQELLERKFNITHHTIQVDPVVHGANKCSSNICQH